MKYVPDGPSSLRAIFETLVRVPESVRAYAQQHVGTLVVGGSSRGWTLRRAAFDGVEHLVVLHARDGIADTFAHELAHVMCAHADDAGGPCGEHEREAAALAASWGFAGPSADPDSAERALSDGVARETPPSIVSTVTADSIRLECSACGRAAHLLCPTVPGLSAVILAECPASCPGVAVIELAEVPCPCGARATVTWAAGATPEHPVVLCTCTCGASVIRTVVSAAEPQQRPPSDIVIPQPDEPAEHFYLRQAIFALTAKNGEPEPGAGALRWARDRLSLALREMTQDDPRRVELEAAVAVIARGDVGAAADAVARAARALDVQPPTREGTAA